MRAKVPIASTKSHAKLDWHSFGTTENGAEFRFFLFCANPPYLCAVVLDSNNNATAQKKKIR